MKKLTISKDTLMSLNDNSAQDVNGGTQGQTGWVTGRCATYTCPVNVLTPLAGPYGAALGLLTNICNAVTSNNGCATLHTCKWSGITTQACG